MHTLSYVHISVCVSSDRVFEWLFIFVFKSSVNTNLIKYCSVESLESKYLTFLSEITQDILAQEIYFGRGLDMLLQRHIDRYRRILDVVSCISVNVIHRETNLVAYVVRILVNLVPSSSDVGSFCLQYSLSLIYSSLKWREEWRIWKKNWIFHTSRIELLLWFALSKAKKLVVSKRDHYFFLYCIYIA